MITDINSEDRLVQEAFAEYLERHLAWESVYAPGVPARTASADA